MIEHYITTIALSVIGLVTIGALTLGTVVYRKLKPAYEARFSIEQRPTGLGNWPRTLMHG